MSDMADCNNRLDGNGFTSLRAGRVVILIQGKEIILAVIVNKAFPKIYISRR